MLIGPFIVDVAKQAQLIVVQKVKYFFWVVEVKIIKLFFLKVQSNPPFIIINKILLENIGHIHEKKLIS